MKKIYLVFPLVLALIIGLMAACEGGVNPSTKKNLTSIAVTNPPTKTVYDLNTTDTLSTAGMVVTATYSDNSTAPVTGYTCSTLDAATLGNQDITVTYQKKTATFTVLVRDSELDDVDTPSASPGAGQIPSGTTVTLSSTTGGAEIWYTTNDSTPAKNGTGSTKYTTPIPITAAVTIKAIAVKDGMNDSAVLTAAYTVTVIDPGKQTCATPVADPGAGYVNEDTEVYLETATAGAEIWYTTNGDIPVKGGPSSTLYTDADPILITTAVTIKAIAVKDGMNDSTVLTAAYNISEPFARWTVTQSGGVEHKEDTIQLNFAFTKNGASYTIPRDGILLEDITITDGTGSITPNTTYTSPLSTSEGPTRFLYIKVLTQGTVTIKINLAGISDEEQTVMVYKKTGFQPDPSVTIDDVVKMGTPTAGPNISFASNDGDPIAILPPRTNDPITTISATNYAFEQVLATFDPPLDLRTTPERDFRWFDMVWDGFGDQEFDGKGWDFETETTATSNEGTYTGTRWDLHNVAFQLDLITTTGATVRFQKTSETNTTTGDKKPVQFLKTNIVTTGGYTAWGEGHQITQIILRASGMQLRDPYNKVWAAISAQRNPVIGDTWISLLAVDARLPPSPYALYGSSGWAAEISNPKYSFAEIGLDETSATGGFEELGGVNGEQKIVYWDPIDITVRPTAEGRSEYSAIAIEYTGSNLNWFGYGTLSMSTNPDYTDPIKGQAFDGGASFIVNNVIRLPLSGYGDAEFNPEQFVGFFLQWDSGNITITGISLE